ncbi:MAG: 50S ribosomal protein L10 [Phycisphaerae bacterium]
MSKPVKKLVRDELIRRFQGMTQLAVVGFTGVDANTNNEIRARLRGKEIRMTVVKNALARQAFREIGLGQASGLLDGPCAVAYSTDPDAVGIVTVIRELLEINREAPSLSVKAAFMDGELFAADQIEALSRYPTRDEAVAQAVQCVLSPGANLAACLVGPAGQIAGILKAIEEKAGDSGGSQAA